MSNGHCFCKCLQTIEAVQVGMATQDAAAFVADHLNILGYDDAAKLILQPNWGAADLRQICQVTEAVNALAA